MVMLLSRALRKKTLKFIALVVFISLLFSLKYSFSDKYTVSKQDEIADNQRSGFGYGKIKLNGKKQEQFSTSSYWTTSTAHTTMVQNKRSPPSTVASPDIIHDYDVIEDLKNYTFKLRTEDPDAIQRYPASKTIVNSVKEKCDNITYNISKLPTASIVISFHENERVQSILHTIHSIYQNSPKELLKEIILVDDNSRKESHKEPLEEYIQSHFPKQLVSIHRHKGPENLGLIQARLLGIKHASADVFVVMDAHMELQPKWLEPLLQAIYEQRNTMATSMLDWMRPTDTDPNIWNYEHGSPLAKTTWVWKTFNFGFRSSRMREIDDPYPIKPIESPMSVGTIWAMDRELFFEIGGFDDKMVLWGGENIELPIRVHLCSGGRVVNVPCSKASHQEMRHQRDYRAGWRAKFLINFKRIGEVWLDGEYKETYDFYNFALQDIDPGDLSERRKLRAEKCPRPFSYYLNKAFPEMGVDARSFGWKGMMNLMLETCFYYSPDFGSYKMVPCSVINPMKEQAVFLSLDGHLRQYLSVFNLVETTLRNKSSTPETPIYKLKRVDYYFTYFSNRQTHTKWIHTRDGCLYAYKLQRCLGVDESGYMYGYRCSGTCSDPSMQWRFRKYTHYYMELKDESFSPDVQTDVKDYYNQYRKFSLEKDPNVTNDDIANSESEFSETIKNLLDKRKQVH